MYPTKISGQNVELADFIIKSHFGLPAKISSDPVKDQGKPDKYQASRDLFGTDSPGKDQPDSAQLSPSLNPAVRIPTKVGHDSELMSAIDSDLTSALPI